MARIDESANKYEAKIPAMKRNYTEGVSSFIGFDISASAANKAYQSKIVPGKGQYWKEQYIAAFRS
jgi:hypothetical protein